MTPARSAPPTPLAFGKHLVLLMLIGVGSSGCESPGERAIARLEQGLSELVVMVERRDRGELDDTTMTAELKRWHEGPGRDLEFVAREAARSSGPDLRAELDQRWQVLAKTLEQRLESSRPAP